MDSIFTDSLVLKLRFAGFGLVQLSTDPDPPSEEVGCSGTHMLHAADGNKKFNRALVWQNVDKLTNIIREPLDKLPPIGVNIVDATLQITNNLSTAGYVPQQIMSSAGAVQTDGVQQFLQIEGLIDLVNLSARDLEKRGSKLGINLAEKNGVKPFLYGDNHLVSKDGEPIDPFIISICNDSYDNLFSREIYNKGLDMSEMSPLQRLNTARWPVGFDFNLRNIPSWVINDIHEDYSKLIYSLGFPISYLDNRSAILYEKLDELLTDINTLNQDKITEIISYSERLSLITLPRGTTVAWLGVLLNYGHSISGDISLHDSSNLIFNLLKEKTSIDVRISNEIKNRDQPNSRWLIKYTKGVMDTDAITDLVYGELFVPLTVTPNNIPASILKEWKFSILMKNLLVDFACDFKNPFWADYQIVGDMRELNLSNGILIVDSLIKKDINSYTYSSTGIDGITDYESSFNVTENIDHATLTWTSTFNYTDSKTLIKLITIIGQFFEQMTKKLTFHVSPV